MATTTTKTYTVTSAQRLSNSGFHRSGGSSSGAAHWWLRDNNGNFVDLPKRVRGDAKDWSLEVELEPGRYTLGVGRSKDAIRVRFEATPDGQWICP